jgi:hypothetical protein
MKKLYGKKSRIAKILSTFCHKKSKDVSVRKIMFLTKRHSSYFVILLSLLPLTIGMLTPILTIFMIPAVLLSFQNLFNKKRVIDLHLPKLILNIRIKRYIITSINNIARNYIRKIEHITKRRIAVLFKLRLSIIFHDFLIVLLLLCIMIPIPILYIIPGVALLIIIVSILFQDGLLLLIGDLVGIIGIITSYLLIKLTILFFNLKVFSNLESTINNFFSNAYKFYFE